MGLLQRILGLSSPASQAEASRPPTVLVEFLADRGRLEQELAELRADVAAGARGRTELAEQFSAASTAILESLAGTTRTIKSDLIAATRDEVAQVQTALVERLDQLAGETGKLGREQFRATTLLDGQALVLDELTEEWRAHLEQREREAAEVRRALSDLESQVRLGLIRDLLPVADALGESVRAACALLAGLEDRAQPGPSPLARLLGARPAPAAGGERRAALESWLRGLLLVERRLLALLEREGVRPIPAVGQPFDPHRHLALAVEHNGRYADGTVIREELRGYMLGDRVLRHAEVVVARGGAGDARPSETEEKREKIRDE